MSHATHHLTLNVSPLSVYSFSRLDTISQNVGSFCCGVSTVVQDNAFLVPSLV